MRSTAVVSGAHPEYALGLTDRSSDCHQKGSGQTRACNEGGSLRIPVPSTARSNRTITATTVLFHVHTTALYGHRLAALRDVID